MSNIPKITLLLALCLGLSAPAFAGVDPAPPLQEAANVSPPAETSAEPTVAPAISASPAPAPAQAFDPSSDPGAAVKAVVAAAQAGDWKLAVILAVCLAVWALRKFGRMLPGAVGEWTQGDVGGIVLTFLATLSGVLAGAAVAGLPFTANLVMGALMLAFTAMGAWRAVKILLRKLPTTWQAKLDWLFGLLPKDDAPAAPKPAASSANLAPLVILLFLVPVALSACSAAPIRREVCVGYVTCAMATAPASDAALKVQSTYGSDSACWANDHEARACVEACEAGLASLKSSGIECAIPAPVKEVK